MFEGENVSLVEKLSQTNNTSPKGNSFISQYREFILALENVLNGWKHLYWLGELTWVGSGRVLDLEELQTSESRTNCKELEV